MHNVIVDEEQLRNSCQTLHSKMDQVEARYRMYLNYLRRVRLNVIVSGETADALSAFTERAQALQLQFDNLANDFEELTGSYIREIDSVDDF